MAFWKTRAADYENKLTSLQFQKAAEIEEAREVLKKEHSGELSRLEDALHKAN